MAQFLSSEKDREVLYRYLIGCVVPRPIAWVLTRSREGRPNLAPFSFFNAAGNNPPTLAFTVADRGEELKDTSRNIGEHPEFVVHIVTEDLMEAMNMTSGDYGADISETSVAGLETVPGTVVDVPRLVAAPVALECRLTHHLRLGNQAPRSSHILGEVVCWHFEDRVLSENAREPVNPEALAAVGRMGGMNYSRTRDRFRLERPAVSPEDPRSIPSARTRGKQPR
ncbi:MAG: flavin reductase family protein [Deltaproteobacteria bacterium]|nr:flavin reductase family protein [Deltaproteobacteria bacterium]